MKRVKAAVDIKSHEEIEKICFLELLPVLLLLVACCRRRTLVQVTHLTTAAIVRSLCLMKQEVRVTRTAIVE